MPMFDRRCESCGAVQIDCFESSATPDYPCACGGVMHRSWVSKPPAVIGDECDVWIKHGICNEDGSPRHYRFKSEMRAEAKRRNVRPHVEHMGTSGGDKSKHTSRWF